MKTATSSRADTAAPGSETVLEALTDIEVALAFADPEMRRRRVNAALAKLGLDTAAALGDVLAPHRNLSEVNSSFRSLSGTAERNPSVRYSELHTATPNADWFSFMNHGYADATPNPGSPEHNHPWRHQIQLYLYLADLAIVQKRCPDLSDLHVLDVGCGRGGGAAALRRYRNAQSVVGLDLTPANVAFCRRTQPDEPFVIGDAMQLPLEEASIDVVLNIESCHCYPDTTAFVDEVHRVLKPGGVFVVTDLREALVGVPLFRWALEQSQLGSWEHRDITAEVRRACLADAATFGPAHFGLTLDDTAADIPRRVAEDKAALYQSAYASYVVALATKGVGSHG